VEPSVEVDLVVRPLLLGLRAYVRAVRFIRMSALTHLPGKISPTVQTYFAEITSIEFGGATSSESVVEVCPDGMVACDAVPVVVLSATFLIRGNERTVQCRPLLAMEVDGDSALIVGCRRPCADPGETRCRSWVVLS
jgi:hypothetical protein